MILLRNFGNIFKIPELVKKLLFTLGVIVVYRIGIFIPAVGVNTAALSQYFEQAKALKGFLGYFSTFSGGAFLTSSIFALGIGPYITASIMMQMLSMTIPYLEQLSKEGDYGRKIINQYTRYLAIGLSIVYALGYSTLLQNQGVLASGLGYKLLFILILTAGAIFVMWLGEQISLYGIGNGSSMIIFAGIVSELPKYAIDSYLAVQNGSMSVISAFFIIAIFIAVAACIVYLEKGERKISVQYARRVVGQKVYSGQSSYIPFKINTSGVMPVIFATSLLNIPIFIVGLISGYFPGFKWLQELMVQGGPLYSAFEFGLIIFFTFFYTAIAFNPEELAQNIKKGGGFIPGIRPGRQTANYFDYILNRIGLIGAVYLGLLAVAPNFLRLFINMPFYMSGTALLIMVGVALETSSQIESYLIEHRYEGFLSSGKRIKSKVAR